MEVNTSMYTWHEQWHLRLEIQYAFTLATKKVKQLCTNLTKYIQDLYGENCNFVDIDKLDSKIIDRQKTQNSQHDTEQEEIGRLTLPDFRTYYKRIVITTVW